MKTFFSTKDRKIDNLLRSHISERRGSEPRCGEFDPDLANSYIEQLLTPAENARFESHIAGCHPCRKSVVTLARLADPIPVASSHLIASAERQGRVAGFKGLLTTLATPRMALTATAVMVLAISIPLALSRRDGSTDRAMQASSETAIAEGQERSNNEAPVNSSSADLEGNIASTDTSQPASAERQASRVAQGTVAEAGQPAPLAPPETQLIEARNVSESKDEVVAGAPAGVQMDGEQPPAPAPPQTAKKQEELPRIDSAQALQVPQKDKDSTYLSLIQPGRTTGEQKRETDATIRPDAAAPPPESVASERADRRGIASPTPGNALRDVNTARSSRARDLPGRKVAGKRFYLMKDIWTDKDYNPSKERPEVTIIRDSDIYNEMLTKNNGLRLFFTNFAKDERVIVVYKGTVYKLIPQENK